jgi:hypothetical protein
MAMKYDGNIATDLHQHLLREYLFFLIALMCMTNLKKPSLIIGNKDFSGVWVIRPMSYANAIICLSSL